MQEGAKCPAAEALIVARVENEFVPEIVGDNRRHRHEAAPAHQVSDEELPKPTRDQRCVLAAEVRMVLHQLLQEARRPLVGPDIFRAAQAQPGIRQHRECDDDTEPEYGVPDGHGRNPVRAKECP
jgi:hypothetical protein